MERISPALLTVYADLVQSLAAGEAQSASVYPHAVKGVEYLYAARRDGRGRTKVYLGRADDPAVRARAELIKASTERAKGRRTAVASLRAARLPMPPAELGRVLEALDAGGLFRNGGVLVGTGAFQCMSPLVGFILPATGMATRDVDIATASLALSAGPPPEIVAAKDEIEGKTETATFEQLLRHADPTFAGLPTLDRKAFPCRFRNASGFMVELLVPVRSRADKEPMPIPALKAGAIPIQHIGWLIENPVPAAALHGSGVFVMVPQPARYAVHKLLIAPKRIGDASKRVKDLLQAAALIEVLRETDPDALFDALDDARSRGREGWEKPINASLKSLALSTDTLEPLPPTSA